MARFDIARQRLHRQRLSFPTLERAEDLVRWLGAVQAQDFAAAKWAVAQRTTGLTEAAIDRAFDEGRILRTHVLRPTWHFVVPADLRWMLALSAPRVRSLMAYYDRQLGLTRQVLARSRAILASTLREGGQLTRAELAPALRPTGVAVDHSQTLGHLLMHAELDGIICSGARHGKQHTYALLDGRAESVRAMDRDEALAELARRYFASRGPATLKDYAWWSGLGTEDARAGLEVAKSALVQETVKGQVYWRSMADPRPRGTGGVRGVYLLPAFDEYLVAYADRSSVWDARHTSQLDSRGQLLATNTLCIDGQIVGSWKGLLKAHVVMIETRPWRPLAQSEKAALEAAAERYGTYLGRSVLLS